MSERTQTGERAACTRHVLDNFEADRDLHVNGFERDRGFANSPLEGDGFEPSVPGDTPWVPSWKMLRLLQMPAGRRSHSTTLRGC
jgi:hypothetical protein